MHPFPRTDRAPSGGVLMRASRAGRAGGPDRLTAADIYRSITSALMVLLGAVILVRTLAFGFHFLAVLVGLGFIGLGAYRLSFVVAYLRRSKSV